MKIITVFLVSLFIGLVGYANSDNANPLIRIHLDHVDLRGEPQGGISNFFVYPVHCRQRISVQYYEPGREFLEKNKILTSYRRGGSSLENEFLNSLLCIAISDELNIYSRHEVPRGIDNFLDRDFLDFSYDANRPELLLVWMNLHNPSTLQLFSKIVSGDWGPDYLDQIVGFNWVTLSPNQEPFIKINSIFNPIQNISLKIKFAKEKLPFSERMKLKLTK
jgi:hypothetical protein